MLATLVVIVLRAFALEDETRAMARTKIPSKKATHMVVVILETGGILFREHCFGRGGRGCGGGGKHDPICQKRVSPSLIGVLLL